MHSVPKNLSHSTLPISAEYLEYNKGPEFLAIVASLVSIALLTFLFRVYTRTRILGFFGVDDSLMLVAAVCAIAVLIIYVQLTSLGFGKHPRVIPLDNVLAMGPLLWCFTLILVLGISFVKLSVAFFLLRIIQRTAYRRLFYGLTVALTALTLVWFGTLVFRCYPVKAAWDSTIRPAKCMSGLTYRNIGIFNNSINVATDIMFATIPIPIIWNLRIGLGTRISLIAVLGLGFIACAAAIVRMPLIYRIVDQDDPFGDGARLLLWSVIELATGITAACLPTIKPLLKLLLATLPRLSPPHSQSRHTIPKPTLQARYHDPASNLTFELETPPHARIRSATHTRTPSGLSVFTNFSLQQFDGKEMSRSNLVSASASVKGVDKEVELELGMGIGILRTMTTEVSISTS